MKLALNKFLILTFLLVGLSSYAQGGDPPPPPGPPIGPGIPIDGNLYILVFFGVLFSFIYFKNYIKSNKKI